MSYAWLNTNFVREALWISNTFKFVELMRSTAYKLRKFSAIFFSCCCLSHNFSLYFYTCSVQILSGRRFFTYFCSLNKRKNIQNAYNLLRFSKLGEKSRCDAIKSAIKAVYLKPLNDNCVTERKSDSFENIWGFRKSCSRTEVQKSTKKKRTSKICN